MESIGDAQGMLERLMAECVARDASDVHLAPGLAPRFRLHGDLVELDRAPVLPAAQLRAVAAALLRATGVPDGEAPSRLASALAGRGSVDGAVTAPGGVRFRFNVFLRQGEIAVALRRLEDRFRSLAELGMPEGLHSLCDLRDGLVVITGPTGAGKSTTLATLIDRINRTRPGHIITIEDPIEYLHASARCVVNQRQVGLDAPSFNDALVASLRP